MARFGGLMRLFIVARGEQLTIRLCEFLAKSPNAIDLGGRQSEKTGE